MRRRCMRRGNWGRMSLLAVIIPVLDTGYNEIAVWLNDMGECTKIAGGRMIQLHTF